jgi:hypothetical protein
VRRVQRSLSAGGELGEYAVAVIGAVGGEDQFEPI